MLELYSTLDQLTCPVDSRLLYNLPERVSIYTSQQQYMLSLGFCKDTPCAQF
jgi:hypothetical protein